MLKAIPSSNTVHIMIIVSCLIRLSKVKNNDFSSSETTIIIMLHSWTMVIQQVIQYSFITIKISKEKWQPFSCELGEFIFLRPIDQASQSRFRNPPHRPARPKRKNIFLVCIFIVFPKPSQCSLQSLKSPPTNSNRNYIWTREMLTDLFGPGN